MEVIWYSCESEEYKNSILGIEKPTAQKVIDSENFVQAYCLTKALKIIIEKENIDVLDYNELNNFLSEFFGSENIEYLIKNGYHICGEYMGDDPDDVRFEAAFTLSDKRQRWWMQIQNSGEMSTGPLTDHLDISKLFSNEKKLIYDGHTARVMKYVPASEGETFKKVLEERCCVIERRVELPSWGVKYDFIDEKGNKKYALCYEEDPTYEWMTGNVDEIRDPEFAIILISDYEIVKDGASDYPFYSYLSSLLKYDLRGRFDFDLA